jgi:ABC-type xylose transport system permease subunit
MATTVESAPIPPRQEEERSTRETIRTAIENNIRQYGMVAALAIIVVLF